MSDILEARPDEPEHEQTPEEIELARKRNVRLEALRTRREQEEKAQQEMAKNRVPLNESRSYSSPCCSQSSFITFALPFLRGPD